MRNAVLSFCTLAVAAAAAGAQTWTFESPNFTGGESTPLLNRAPNINPGSWAASFTSAPNANGLQINNFQPTAAFSGNCLYVPSTQEALTIVFNQPVTDLTVDFAINTQNVGWDLVYVTTDGPGSVGAGPAGGTFYGGTLSLTGLSGITSITLFANDPTGNMTQFAIDNLTVTPTPGAAAALGLAGAASLRRRRR